MWAAREACCAQRATEQEGEAQRGEARPQRPGQAVVQWLAGTSRGSLSPTPWLQGAQGLQPESGAETWWEAQPGVSKASWQKQGCCLG